MSPETAMDAMPASGSPPAIPNRMTWTAALLPFGLLTLLAVFWPNPQLALFLSVFLIVPVVLDSRILHFRYIDLSWAWGLATAPPYLLVRARRTGVAWSAAWLSLASTAVWIGAVVATFVAWSQLPTLDDRLLELNQARLTYRLAWTDWVGGIYSSDAQAADELERATAELKTVIDDVQETSNARTASDNEEAAAALSVSLDALVAVVAGVHDPADPRQQAHAECSAIDARRDTESAMLDYYMGLEHPATASVVGDLRQAQLESSVCAFRVKIYDAFGLFDKSEFVSADARTYLNYSALSDRLKETVAQVSDDTWPTMIPSMDDYIEALDDAQRAAAQVASAAKRGDSEGTIEAHKHFKRAVHALGEVSDTVGS